MNEQTAKDMKYFILRLLDELKEKIEKAEYHGEYIKAKADADLLGIMIQTLVSHQERKIGETVARANGKLEPLDEGQWH